MELVQDKKEVWVIQHPSSRYGVAQEMSHEISLAFSQIDMISHLYTRGDPEYLRDIETLSEEGRDILCRFVVNQVIPDDMIFEFFGIPHISFLLDAAPHSPELLYKKFFPSSIVSFVDGDSVTFFEKIIGRKAFWIPHGIDVERIQAMQEADVIWNIPYEKRPIDLLISGSWIDFEKEERLWKGALMGRSLDIMYGLVERVLSSKEHSNHLILLHEILESDEDFRRDIKTLFSNDLYEAYISLEKYIRGTDRVSFLRKLTGFQGNLTILTHEEDVEKWQRFLPSDVEASYVINVPYVKTWSYYAQSKLVLNSVPTIKKGVHERLLAALFSGARVLSTYSSLMPFHDSCVDVASIQTADDLMALLEAVPKNREALQMEIIREHSWKSRFKKIWPEIDQEIVRIKSTRREYT